MQRLNSFAESVFELLAEGYIWFENDYLMISNEAMVVLMMSFNAEDIEVANLAHRIILRARPSV